MPAFTFSSPPAQLPFISVCGWNKVTGAGSGILPVQLSSEQVEALSPDAASTKAGRGLATAAKWPALGTDDACAWGLCKGSGSKPYEVRVDLREMAYKCSCPSRKFPCKHALGLLFLLASQPGTFTEKAQPDWVSAWMASRSQRAEKKAEQAEGAARKDADPEAQAKRAAKREDRVSGGVEELELWMSDLLRRGLIAVRGEGYAFWDRMAGRLVDAQAPGLARAVRELPGIISSKSDWEERTLRALGRLWLAVQGWKRLDQLPPLVQEDVRAAVGFPKAKEEILALEPVRDVWTVRGMIVEETEPGLRTMRTWLLGAETGRWALLLDFAPRAVKFENAYAPGLAFDAALAFYPSSVPLRALIKERFDTEAAPAAVASQSLEEALAEFGRAIGRMPWLPQWPLCLRGRLLFQDGTPRFVDEGGRVLPMVLAEEKKWEAAAAGAGRLVPMMGEWDGHQLRVLTLQAGRRPMGVGG